MVSLRNWFIRALFINRLNPSAYIENVTIEYWLSADGYDITKDLHRFQNNKWE